MNESCRVKLHWLTSEEGGRINPFQGSRYTPTARFAGETDQFSVVLTFAQGKKSGPTSGELRLLNPDLTEIRQRIRPGAAIEIMEGARVVARCVVAEMYEAVAAS